MLRGPIRFTNALGGTADFIYPGPAIDMQSPASAGAANAAVYVYYAQSFDMVQWEIGSGAYTSASGTFARTTVIANSNGDTAKINFSNPPQIMVFDTAAAFALASDVTTLQGQTAGYESAWTPFTSTLTSAGGALTTATASGRYKQIGKTVFFSITGVITNNGTGSSWLRFTPPVAPLSTGNFTFDSYNVTDNILLMGRFLAGNSNIDVFKTDGTYPGASGKTYIVSGEYEAN